MTTLAYNKTHIEKQKSATEALLKFCKEHSYDVDSLEPIRLCLEALKKSDVESAVNYYQKVPLGGYGCFNDWLPPVVYENETESYVSAVFEALVTRWSILMRLSLPISS